jgi:sulfonate transport system permease protein
VDSISSQAAQIFVRPVGLVGLLVGWQLFAWYSRSPLIPSLDTVAASIASLILSPRLWGHILASVERLLIGLTIAVAIGVLIGIAMAQSRWLFLILNPVVDLVRAISGLAIYPVIVLVLGLTAEAKIFLIYWAVWPPVVLNTLHGILHVATPLVEAGRVHGASEYQVFFRVSLPLAVPTILTGARIGAGAGWISLVAAEMLGGNNGLGYFVLSESQRFNFANVYAGVFFISVFGLISNTALIHFQSEVERRLNI